ncbi:MAG: DUF6125 family protein [Dehalococcoidia bacterium]
MAGNLSDYSGEFDPDIRLDDFDKEALLRLYKAASRCYITIDGIWMSLVREKFGDEVARELELKVWNWRALPMEARRICRALNIEGSDVATLFKFFQTQPGFAGLDFDITYELKDRNHGICTVKRCLSLEYFERHDDMDTAKYVCEVIDATGFQDAAHYFNPDMTAKPLKLPPRRGEDDIACQWEYRVR